MEKTRKDTNYKGIVRRYLYVFIIFAVVVSGVGLTFGVNSATSRSEAVTGVSFALEMEGASTGYFTDVTGIGSSVQVIEHKVVSGGKDEIIQKIPGRLSLNEATLRRGITTNKDMWDWMKKVENGNIGDARVNCSIIAYDQSHNQIAQWDLKNVWPTQITQTNSSDGLVEEIVIVYESQERVK